jgi:carboxylesterase type B
LSTGSHVPSWAAGSGRGAYHSSEIPFVFGDVLENGKPFMDEGRRITPTAGERHLSERMVAWWSEFARSGFRGEGGGGAWPRYENATDALLQLGVGPATRPVEGFRAQFCDVWDELLWLWWDNEQPTKHGGRPDNVRAAQAVAA